MEVMSQNDLNTLSNFDRLPDVALVRLPVVAALYACSKPTVWRKVKKGTIPSPHRKEGITAWNVGELRQDLNRK